MKKHTSPLLALLFLALLVGGCKTKQNGGNAKTVSWKSIEEVAELAQKERKNIIVDVYAHWCGPCKMLDAHTFKDREFIQVVNEHFHAVKFNAEHPDEITLNGETFANPDYDPNKRGRNGKHEWASQLGIKGLPTIVVLDPDLKVLKKIVGFREAEDMLNALKPYYK